MAEHHIDSSLDVMNSGDFGWVNIKYSWDKKYIERFQTNTEVFLTNYLFMIVKFNQYKRDINSNNRKFDLTMVKELIKMIEMNS